MKHKKDMKHSLISVFLVAASLSAVACDQSLVVDFPGKGKDDNPYKGLELTSKSEAFVEQGNSFTFNFISRIDASAGEDYVVSPLSLQFLLGMILDGARGETADEICSTLGYGAGEVSAVDEYCRSMLSQLPKLDKMTTLSIADAIVVNDRFPLLDSYKERVAGFYNAEVSNKDFFDSERTLSEINGWCARQTAGLIPKILEKVTPDMLCYLMNAVYFKSNWADKFDKSATVEKPFTKAGGKKVDISMMQQTAGFDYYEDDLFQAVRLPYGNGSFAMTVLLPKEGHDVAAIAEALRTGDSWKQIGMSMRDCDVDLWLPRFETSFKVKLNDILTGMGMGSSFDPLKADFKNMSEYALCLSFVQQNAVIKVNEEGSEAAAISSAGMLVTTALPGARPKVVFHADHPFLYLISETGTGAVLFAGRYGAES